MRKSDEMDTCRDLAEDLVKMCMDNARQRSKAGEDLNEITASVITSVTMALAALVNIIVVKFEDKLGMIDEISKGAKDALVEADDK